MVHTASRRAVGHRLAVAALALSLGAAAAACSSGSTPKTIQLKSVTPTTPAGSSPGGAAAAGSPPGGGTSQLSTAPAGGASTGQKPGTAPGTSAQPARTAPTTKPSTTTKTTTPGTAGPAPTAPGTYTYRAQGSSMVTSGSTTTSLPVASQSALVVTNTGSGTEQWVNSSTTTSGTTSTTTNLIFNGSGVFLQSETVPVVNTTCTFTPPVAYPPWPLAIGKSFSGTATCGSSTVTLTGSVTGTKSVTVAGKPVSTYVVKSTLSLGTSLTVVETDWYAPSVRVPVQSTVSANGSYLGYTIASNMAYALTAFQPS